MCTLLVLNVGDGGFVLAANRDELHTRSPAQAPRVLSHGELQMTYPLDPDGGGSWIAANSAGLAVMLLNYFEAEAGMASPAEPISRGLVVTRLASSRSLDELEAACRGSAFPPLHRVAPFVLIAVESGEPDSSQPRASRVVWDGRRLALSPWAIPGVESSSGRMGAQARVTRKNALMAQGLQDSERGTGLSAAEIRAAFAWHHPAADSRSLCVHGPVGGSRSHTVVRVSSAQVSMSYFEGPPCGVATPLVTELPRDSPASAFPPKVD